jgi:hypothetical protein
MTTPTEKRGFGSRLADTAIDASGVAGMGLITYGAHQVFDPAGYIVAGMFLLFVAWQLARKAPDGHAVQNGGAHRAPAQARRAMA